MDQGWVISSTSGAWGSAQAVPGLAGLNTHGDAQVTAVSCVASGNCGIAGLYMDADGLESFFGEQSGGTWDGSSQLPGTSGGPGGSFSEPTSESCPAFADCTIGGFLTDSTGTDFPYVDDQDPMTHAWPAALPLAGGLNKGNSRVTSVSCASPRNCAAGGWYTDAHHAKQAFVISETPAGWKTFHPVAVSLNKGGSAQVNEVSCASNGNCSAVGSYQPTTTMSVPFAINLRNGVWGPMLALPGVAKLDTGHFSFASSVSCGSPGDCTADGAYFVAKTKTQPIFVDTEKNWTWSTAIGLPGIGALNTGRDAFPGPVSCVSPGDCSAAGDYTPAGGSFQVWSDSQRNGTWASAQPLLGLISISDGPAQVNGLSCARTTLSCGMVGYYSDIHGGQQPFVASGAIAAATSVSGTASAQTVVYGHEQSERISVLADSQFGAHPTGTVAIKAGSLTACVITLAAGKGSCLVPAAKFRAGPVAVLAFYGGAIQFLGSKSGTLTFTVAKAATRTGLALSAGKITVGHEQAERLSVGLAPQFGGVPAGTVTVAAGSTTICVITLKAGKGSCTLTASKLKAGTYHLVATYHGGTDFKGSSSGAKTLTVVR
jgi:Bacterial Ig-like domain (group 3)